MILKLYLSFLYTFLHVILKRPADLFVLFRSEIMLVKIHSLLTKRNSKLTNIETKNSFLETSLTQNEKKITAIGHIREDLDKVTSHGQAN